MVKWDLEIIKSKNIKEKYKNKDAVFLLKIMKILLSTKVSQYDQFWQLSTYTTNHIYERKWHT
jgi:hypothetical protein